MFDPHNTGWYMFTETPAQKPDECMYACLSVCMYGCLSECIIIWVYECKYGYMNTGDEVCLPECDQPV